MSLQNKELFIPIFLMNAPTQETLPTRFTLYCRVHSSLTLKSAGNLFSFLKIALPILIWALTPVQGAGQGSDLVKLGRERKVVIPFTLQNNFIVINTIMNERRSLRFIIDTGAESTILLDKQIADRLDVDYRRKFTVAGSDMQKELVAYLATGITLQLGESILAKQRSMLVLEENYANLDEIIGVPIHGIIGADFLMRFVVEINYRKQEITLHEPGKFRVRSKFEEIPSVFHRHRAYLKVPISFSSRKASSRKLLLDSGASISLLLHTFTDTLRQEDLPVATVPSYIASGIGGDVNGNVGRAQTIELGSKYLRDVVTHFQAIDSIGKPYLNDRNGILGNRILSRYIVVIDYVHERVYLRPDARAIRKKFKFDRSGMSIVAGGFRLTEYYVAKVVKDSPAYRAGIREGDRISAVNKTSVYFLSLGGIIDRMRAKVGKRIRIKYFRDGNVHRTEFRLKDLI